MYFVCYKDEIAIVFPQELSSFLIEHNLDKFIEPLERGIQQIYQYAEGECMVIDGQAVAPKARTTITEWVVGPPESKPLEPKPLNELLTHEEKRLLDKSPPGQNNSEPFQTEWELGVDGKMRKAMTATDRLEMDRIKLAGNGYHWPPKGPWNVGKPSR